MGCCSSAQVAAADTGESNIESELEHWRKGEVPAGSFRHNLLLMCGSFVINLDSFYEKTTTQQIAQYIHDLGPLKEKEGISVVKMLIKHSESNEEAQSKIKTVLTQMRVELQSNGATIAISPLSNEKLYKRMMKKEKGPWGEKYIPEEIDFSSEDLGEIVQERAINLVFHSNEMSSLVLENPVSSLWTREVKTAEKITFEKPPSKPFRWTRSIHQAAAKGDIGSIKFSLSLLPALLECPDGGGNTPVHSAAESGKTKAILLLHQLGADLKTPNDEGFLPLHLSHDKGVVMTLKSLGCDINCRNANGESLLEIKTRNFDKKVIETLLNYGINILDPNPKGIYWMQYAIHGELYGDMGFLKFQKFVRGIIKKVQDAPYHSNEIYQDIISRKIKDCEQNDVDDLNQSISDKNLERVKVLLALGARADRVRPDCQTTNLMKCVSESLI